MKLTYFKPALLAAFISLSFNAHAQPSALEQRLDQMQKEIENLKKQLAEEKSVRQEQQAAAAAAPAPASGHGSAGTSATTIGGYGEAVYNNFRDKTIKDEADFKRFVLFFGHRFNDKLRLYSELEFEHALIKGNQGEVALEQAYLEYNLHPSANLRAGLMILPLGIINETHEPTTFYGVERNEIERRIIPSTWRELGFAVQGNVLDGLEYNTGISTSLDASRYSDASNGIRGLRSSGAQAAANDLAFFAGLNYRQPGWSIGGSVFTGDTAQDGVGNTARAALQGKNARVTIWDIHGQYSIGNLDLQALYARGTLGDTLSINQASGIAAGSSRAAPKTFWGGYGQAAYHVWKKGDMRLTPFVRYERYNTQAEVDPGFTQDPNNNEHVITAGASFYLSRDVVFKADWQDFKQDDRKDRFNLGIGYHF